MNYTILVILILLVISGSALAYFFLLQPPSPPLSGITTDEAFVSNAVLEQNKPNVNIIRELDYKSYNFLPKPITATQSLEAIDQSSGFNQEIDLAPLEPLYQPPLSGGCTHKCETLLLSSTSYNRKVNIVVIGVGYSNYDIFKKTAKLAFIDNNKSFFSIEPFKSRMKDFNVFLYPQVIPKKDGMDYFVDPAIVSAVKGCIHNYVMVLIAPDNNSQSFGGSARRISIGEAGFNEYTPYLALHEMGGHGIGYLADTYYQQDFNVGGIIIPNCDISPNCEKFNTFKIKGCFTGVPTNDGKSTRPNTTTNCGIDRNNQRYYYKASPASIMGFYYIDYSFNVVEQYIINYRINKTIALNKQIPMTAKVRTWCSSSNQ